jgi:hypothetical protein
MQILANKSCSEMPVQLGAGAYGRLLGFKRDDFERLQQQAGI